MATAVPTPLTPKLPIAKTIADAVEAKAISGATAAPMLAHPKTIICNVPPRIIPAVKFPVTKPINVQVTSG